MEEEGRSVRKLLQARHGVIKEDGSRDGHSSRILRVVIEVASDDNQVARTVEC